MQGTEQFKTIIEAHLNDLASKDSLFKKTLSKENKNIDECINYILTEVKESGCNGFSDAEIFNMAVHYYDENNLKIDKEIKSCQVVVNHSVEKSEKPKTTKTKAKEIVVSESENTFIQGSLF